MPSALYAISYKPTSSVIALCRLEKKTLVDQAAWNQLLATLVGSKLPFSMSTSDPTVEIALPASELGCDLVNDLSPLDLEPVLAEPFRYRVTDPAGSTVPGDGRPKLLKRVNSNSVSSIKMSLQPSPQVTVSLVNPPGSAGARLLFEGRSPISSTSPPKIDPPPKSNPPPKSDPPSNELVFQLPLDLKLNAVFHYAVIFFMEDTPVEPRLVVGPQVAG